MSLQLKRKKKGVSEIIGYVLLIVMAVAMGTITYVWMKSYVPKDSVDCPDGSSISIKSYEYSSASNILNITLKNNGRFNLSGYYIKVINNTNQTIATLDLSQYFIVEYGAVKLDKSISFTSLGNVNSFMPNGEVTHRFDTFNLSRIYQIEIIPTRWQKESKGMSLVICSKSKAKESINYTS